MKPFLSCFALGLLALLPVSAQADDTASADDVAICTLYSKIGSSTVSFMLPLKMQDFVDMMTGKNPELMGTMSQSLLSGLDGNDIATMTKHAEEAALIGEAAGSVGIQSLMSGQASSAEEVQTLMYRQCRAVGAQVIIDNQRQTSALAAQSLGQ